MSVELELVVQSKGGDLEAFEQLVMMYQKQIYNLGYRMMGNEEDASDMTQEAFLKAFKSIKKFNQKSSFGTWLYRIAVNLCIDELRKRKKVRLYPIAHNDTAEERGQQVVADIGDLPDEAVEKGEIRRRVHGAINRLPEHHRTMIVLKDIQGRSYQEIADILGLNMGTVKSRISRARASLKEELEKREEQNLRDHV